MNKFDEVYELSVRMKPDILAFTETWLKSDVYDAEVELPGYNMFHVDRTHSRLGGGVILYCKDDLHPMVVNMD